MSDKRSSTDSALVGGGMAFENEYRRAVEAVVASRDAAAIVHAALFDFAEELGRLVADLRGDGNPLGLRVRFLRKPPPWLDAPKGVSVEDVRDRAAAYAAVRLEAQDLWWEIHSEPGVAVSAASNVPALEPYAAEICGIRTASDHRPRLLRRTAEGFIEVSSGGDAASLLAAFLVIVGDVHLDRAAYNPLPLARAAESATVVPP